MSIPTPSPTVFDASYYGFLAVAVFGVFILALLCCGCVARAQNNDQASLAQNRLLKARLTELQSDPNSSVKDLSTLLGQIEKANHGGLLVDFADSFVVPVTNNAVSKDISAFFYHSSLGRLLLLSTQGTLNTINMVLTIVFSGLAITYINAHVVPTFTNPAEGSLNVTLFVWGALIVFGIFKDQFSIFLAPRLGGTGIIEKSEPFNPFIPTTSR